MGKKWICTDPDNKQYRLDEGQDLWTAKVFTFMQDGITSTIDLDDYNQDEINECMAPYGYSLKEDGKYYPDGMDCPLSNDVIAECIFELELSEL